MSHHFLVAQQSSRVSGFSSLPTRFQLQPTSHGATRHCSVCSPRSSFTLFNSPWANDCYSSPCYPGYVPLSTAELLLVTALRMPWPSLPLFETGQKNDFAILCAPALKMGNATVFHSFALSVQSVVRMLKNLDGQNGNRLHCSSHINHLLSKRPPTYHDGDEIQISQEDSLNTREPSTNCPLNRVWHASPDYPIKPVHASQANLHASMPSS